MHLTNPPRKKDMPVLHHEYQMTGTGEISTYMLN